MTQVRRFPRPWIVEGNENCFWVSDADGKQVAYVYYDERPWGISRSSARRLTRIEALKIARNIARLPELLTRRADSAASDGGAGREAGAPSS